MKITAAAAAIALLVLIAAPLPAGAQQPGKVYRVGFLWESPAVLPEGIESFREGCVIWVGLRARTSSLNTVGRGAVRSAPRASGGMVRLKVDIIVAPSSVYVEAARRATSTIPIILRCTRTRSAVATWPASRGQGATSPGSPGNA